MIEETKIYHCGTLTYTKAALTLLFFWLLWGDFCFTLMESVTTPIMQLKFKALGAMNWEVALFLSTIPGSLGLFLNPIVSFKSDRCRTRWGRRIPFLLFTLPFLVLSLVGLAFGDRLGLWAHGHLHLKGVPPEKMALWTLGILLVIFSIFNVLGTTSFWYLFNDVVPEHLLARFMSLFRTISYVATCLYTFFIFPYSGTHSTAIFLGAAMLYLFGFGLMCLNVREGQHAPPPPYVDGGTGPISMLKTYGKECHSNKIYWYLWLCVFIGSIGGGVGLYDLYFKQSIGLDMFQISRINGTMQLLMVVLVMGAGWLADRFHAIRVVMGAQILALMIQIPASLIWLFWHPGPDAMWTFNLPAIGHAIHVSKVYFVSMGLTVSIVAPIAALSTMWDPVLLMRTFPRSRYGQFCSINNLWRTGGGMLGAFLAGGFVDLVTLRVGKANSYFYLPFWQEFFSIPAFFFFILFYRAWKRHGGDGYIPPVPGEDQGGFSPGFDVILAKPDQLTPGAGAIDSSPEAPSEVTV